MILSKMKYYIFFFTLICICGFTSCQSDDVPNEQNDDWKVYYFDFDEVDHYSIKISEDELYFDSLDTHTDFFTEIIQGDYPEDLSDTLFATKLEQEGYSKNQIPEIKHADLKEIFREKGHDPNVLEWLCMPIYRDILVFKKNEKICGIAKICFDCNQFIIRGTESETENFASFNAFGKLRTLLYGKE